MRGQRTAFTLTEVLTVLVIIAVLTALLLPVFSSAQRGAEVESSVSRLRQLYMALEIYRQNADGSSDTYQGPDAYYQLGLPPTYDTTLYGFSPDFWESPCGYSQEITSTGPVHVPGWISYVASYYSPEALANGSGNRSDYGDYLSTYQQNAVVFVDPYCNPAGTFMSDPFTQKRGLSVTLSGQIINRERMGNAFLLQFYSDPPTSQG